MEFDFPKKSEFTFSSTDIQDLLKESYGIALVNQHYSTVKSWYQHKELLLYAKGKAGVVKFNSKGVKAILFAFDFVFLRKVNVHTSFILFKALDHIQQTGDIELKTFRK